MPPFEFSDEFISFLRDTPTALANFAKVVKKFVEVRGEVPSGGSPPKTPGPREWEEGETHDLTTAGLSQADLNALTEAAAEAVVIERFLAWLHGFAAGFMFKGI